MHTTFQNVLKFSLIITLLLVTGCKKAITEPKNNDPVISAVTVTPSTVLTNGSATVNVTATDADNDPLTYTYMPSGGSIVGNAATVIWTAPGTAGAVSVAVTVKDGQGGEASGSGSLMVTAPVLVTQIMGTASFAPGVNGNLNNSMVALYTSIANWVNYSPIIFGAVTGSGASVSYTLTVNPGNYILDIWKDIDNSLAWSAGDYVGWWGSGSLSAPALTEFQISEGETKTLNIDMFIL